MSLLVRVVDVMVLLWLLVLPGLVVDDAPGDVDAAGGDAKVRLWALTTLFALSCLKNFKLKT